MTTDLHYLDLLDVAQRIQSRELSSAEVTRALLDRITSVDKTLGSYALVVGEQAMADARRADTEIASGQLRGPLHGVPIGIKDLCWTEGVTTAAGMSLYREFKPKTDATVVARLRAAGAVILGKLQMTEGAYVEHHPSISAPNNPWNRNHWTGVSSSGSGVATAAGLCYGALGSDTGGSIRFPSAANGVTGLKPTWGRVSRYGVFELAATLDHVGPMARTAADAGAILSVIAGVDSNDPTTSRQPTLAYHTFANQGAKGIRVGIDPCLNDFGVDEATRLTLSAAVDAVKSMGAEIVEVRFPDVTQILDDALLLLAIEVAVTHERTYPSERDQYGPALAAVIERGRTARAMDYQKIVLRRHDFAGYVQALFDDIDVLAIPATGVASPTIEQMSHMGDDPRLMNAILRFTSPFNMTGSPTITLPGMPTSAGMPVGFQFVGKHFAEAMLVRVGAALQRITDWHRARPPI
jgi:amidase